jgi:hypothetical protein
MKQPRGFLSVLFLLYSRGIILLLLIALVMFILGGYSTFGMQTLSPGQPYGSTNCKACLS